MDERLIAERFGAETPPEGLEPNYNVAPGQMMPIISSDDPHRIVLAKWGYMPHWAQANSRIKPQINARAETVSEKPMFLDSFANRRCLVLADGFYEWRRNGKKRVPYRIALKGGVLFAFAGIWDFADNSEGLTVPSFAIITTEANGLVARIHNRMPVIVPPKQEAVWLDRDTSIDVEKNLLVPFPGESLEMYKVSLEVNKPSFNNPEAIKPAKAEAQDHLH